jgi:hypothetical protein
LSNDNDTGTNPNPNPDPAPPAPTPPASTPTVQAERKVIECARNVHTARVRFKTVEHKVSMEAQRAARIDLDDAIVALIEATKELVALDPADPVNA